MKQSITGLKLAIPDAPAAAPANNTSLGVATPALKAWIQGDKSSAVDDFLAADWTMRPLFAADSALSPSEELGNSAGRS